MPAKQQVETPDIGVLTDPLRFVALCWPDMQLYAKQREVLRSVVDNHETFVHAANETGKSRIAAVVAIWFFASRTPARVITSSSSETQLNNILWSEIRHLISSSRLPLPFSVKNLSLRKLVHPDSQDTEPRDYVIGHVTNLVESFQGHHLPNDKPRVLAIFDEASGVPDTFFEASESWAHRKLVIGNPLSTSNFFYRLCKIGDVPDPAGEAKLLRKVVHIDGRDSPNVQAGLRWKEAGRAGPPPVLIPGLLSYGDYLRREQEWDEVKRTTRLHGRFYEGDQAILFPMSWLDAAMDQKRWDALQTAERTAKAIGVDVAAGGRDNTCWSVIDERGVIEQIVMDTPNTMDIAGRTIHLMNRHGVPPSHVALDAGGGGKQIADRLREQRYEVLSVGFGEGADAKQAYRNRRAELYGELRNLLDPAREATFALPPDGHELRQELAVLPLQYDSEGRMYLPPKERRGGQASGEAPLRELLGRSPDRADSLALAAWAMRRPVLSYTLDRPLLCSGGEDDVPASQVTLTPFLQEIVDAHRPWPREYDDDRERRFM